MDLLAYQAHYACCVDDPSSAPAEVWLLLQELGTGILATKEDTSTIDSPDSRIRACYSVDSIESLHGIIPDCLRHLVDHAMVLGASNTSIIHHAVPTLSTFRSTGRLRRCTKYSGDDSIIDNRLTYPAFLPMRQLLAPPSQHPFQPSHPFSQIAHSSPRTASE